MTIALAAVGFVTGSTETNKRKIISLLREYRNTADLIVFGESFLQGFDSLTWEPRNDGDIAVSADSPTLREIQAAAAKNGIAVSFGWLEKNGEMFYSSQLTFGKDGKVLNHYRRISPGWKVPGTDARYTEGAGFCSFIFEGRTFAVALCGDLWYDENIRTMSELAPDVVLWPVYTDYNAEEWNWTAKQEYALQTLRIGQPVLYVNSVCLNPGSAEAAQGGAAFFKNGKIITELPAGEEGVLIVDLQ